jgi:hypothetical protein
MEGDKFITCDVDGQIIKLKSALVGGLIYGDPEYPMAFYAGKLALEEMGMCLLHALRATIKIQVDVHKFSIKETEEFILFCVAEALRREERRIMNGGQDPDTVMRFTKHNL